MQDIRRTHARSSSAPHALYRFFDSAGRLLYVGITTDLARWRGHATGKPWWREVASATIEHLPCQEAAVAAERAAILAEQPVWNLAHRTPVRGASRAATPQVPKAAPAKQQRTWISVGEAAAILGAVNPRVSRSTVYRSLQDPDRANRWWGTGNWRRKPLTDRREIQVRRSRAGELATGGQPFAELPGDESAPPEGGAEG